MDAQVLANELREPVGCFVVVHLAVSRPPPEPTAAIVTVQQSHVSKLVNEGRCGCVN